MLYLLDANVLIDANRDYYPIKRVAEFWEWLGDVGRKGLVTIPLEVYEEIKDGNDDLAMWAKDDVIRVALLLEEQADVSRVSRRQWSGRDRPEPQCRWTNDEHRPAVGENHPAQDIAE